MEVIGEWTGTKKERRATFSRRRAELKKRG